MLKFQLLGVFTVLLCCLSPCYAAKQFRCAGRIQYRPCDQKYELSPSNKPYLMLQQTQKNAVRASFNGQKISQANEELYAEVRNTSFGKYSSSKRAAGQPQDGQWRGLVKGNGDIYLTLQILSNGSLHETRSMGHVVLKDGQTSFNFISAIPSVNNWNWKVLATAKSF